MKKQDIKKTLDDNYLHDLDSCTLRGAAADLIKLAETYEAQGYSNVAFELDYSYDDASHLLIKGTRVETDEEAAARVAAEDRRKQISREHDLKVFKATAERLGIKIENL